MLDTQQAIPAFTWKDVSSFLAIVISIATAYLTLIRKGKLNGRMGRVLLVNAGHDGFLSIKPEFSLMNTGVRTALVYDIQGELRRLADDQRELLHWAENVTTEFVSADRSTDTRFESFPETIFIAKSDVINQRISLFAEHPYSLQAGDYELTLTVKSDGVSNSTLSLTEKIRVRPQDVQFIKSNLPDKDAPIPVRLRNLRFNFEYGPNTNCYVTKLRSN